MKTICWNPFTFEGVGSMLIQLRCCLEVGHDGRHRAIDDAADYRIEWDDPPPEPTAALEAFTAEMARRERD